MRTTSTATGCLPRPRSACSPSHAFPPSRAQCPRRKSVRRARRHARPGRLDRSRPAAHLLGRPQADRAARLSGARSAAKPNPMKIAVIGGGPAGLYFAISMKLRDASHDVHVFERNREGETFGWGVVFSDQTVENLAANDPALGADHRRRIRPLGRHRGPHSRRDSALVRPRLHRHRPQAPARDPRRARPRAWRRTALRTRVRARSRALGRITTSSSAPTASTAAFATIMPTSSASIPKPAPTASPGSARPRRSTPSPSPSSRPRPGGSGPTPINSRPIARPSSSNAPTRPGAGSPSTR